MHAEVKRIDCWDITNTSMGKGKLKRTLVKTVRNDINTYLIDKIAVDWIE